jgi:hypothetical protein
VSAPIDPDQLAALQALRRGLGDVQVREVIDQPGGDPAPVQASQGALFKEVSPAQP